MFSASPGGSAGKIWGVCLVLPDLLKFHEIYWVFDKSQHAQVYQKKIDKTDKQVYQKNVENSCKSNDNIVKFWPVQKI